MNSTVAKLIRPMPSATHLGLLILRLGFGGMMCYGHGWDKLNTFGKSPSTFPDPLGMGNALSFYSAVGAEFACALLVILGLFTRAACVPLLIAMSVAFFKVHGGKLIFVPNPGASEPALVYIIAFAVIMICGPGKFSLDHTFFAGKGPRA